MRSFVPILFSTLTLAVGSSACGNAGSVLEMFDRAGTTPGKGDVTYASYDACVASVPVPKDSTMFTSRTAGKKVGANLLPLDASGSDAAIRAGLRSSMRAAVESERYYFVVNARCAAYAKSSSHGRGEDDGAYAGTSPSPSGATSSSSGGGSSSGSSNAATNVSTTNNQIVGVDEADIVKNDTKDIVVASGSTARILRAWPAAGTHEISRVTVAGEAKQLFLTETRLVVFSSVPDTSASRGYSSGGYSGSTGCNSYGYGCTYTGDGNPTTVTVFDVTDREHPVQLRTLSSAASLVAARRIGNVVHMVLATSGVSSSSYYTAIPASLTGRAHTEAEVNAAFDALIAENDQRIQKASVNDRIPRITEANGAAHEAAPLTSSLDDGTAFTTLASFDLLDTSAFKAVSVISRTGAIMASANAVYMAVPHERGESGWYEAQDAVPELSTVHKFKIGASPYDTDYAASGIVAGRVLNQFSMDEYAGNLRIATTTGHLPDPNAFNTLAVMAQHDRALDVVGKVDHIAPGEDIRSVRFEDDRGYVVTFKKTDPLYVFDLATPTAPAILGALKIPGFSTYMHRLDATHLLTIGYDANDHGDFAFFDGVLLQIFDVSDAANPKLSFKEKIGTRGSSSEALADHLAFNYFAAKNVLAIPMTICDGGGDGTYGTTMTFSGLLVYNVSVTTGFSLHGRVAHPTTKRTSREGDASPYYDNAMCSNWWANAASEVKRSVFMDDFVYSISDTRVKVNALSALATDLTEYDF